MVATRFLPRKFLFFVLVGCAFWWNCTPVNPQGEAKARQYCGSCHAFPEPSLLPKKAWDQQVLPAMGRMLGLQFFNGRPYQDLYTTTSSGKDTLKQKGITVTEWQQIVHYYRSEAPETLPAQDRPALVKTSDQFVVSMPAAEADPSTVFIRIDPGNKRIYAAHAAGEALRVYNAQLQLLQMQPVGGTLIDMDFENGLAAAGARTGWYTNIGILHPNEGTSGAVHPFTLSAEGTMTTKPFIIDSLPRPVQVQAADLDGDQKTDYLVCGFGNMNGSFFWMHNEGHAFEKKILRNLPGAVKAYVEDFDGDGDLDIMALFAQAAEGIYLFTNDGKGNFTETRVLQFPPVYGSSSFSLYDMDGDGRKDIIYTCGDNADYTADVLKPYHGVYIFRNEKDQLYRQVFFYPIHGCYKAVAADFDGDGDPDLATISYFPDPKQLTESMVYLQNQGGLHFEAYSLPGGEKGHWITMDVADVDGDGDADIVAGSLLPPDRKRQQNEKRETGPPFLLLRNRKK